MKIQKKIAIVDNSTWNIFNFRLSLIKRLKSAGYRVIVIAPIDEYITYLNESYFTKHIPLKWLDPQGKNPIKDLLLVRELTKIYKKEKPDYILHFTIKPNLYGNIAAQLAKIPSISIVTGLGYTFLNPSFINKLVPLFYKVALRKVKKLVVYNPDDQAVFINKNIIDKDRCLVIPGSGVNTNYYRPLVHNKNHRKFIFLFIGRLLYDKGLREFVEAAKQVRQIGKNAECWVIGDLNPGNPSAVPKKVLFHWVESKYIRYFGTTKEVRNFIKQADVLVLPSYREGVPKSVLEAMAMGTPIITTLTAGCRETVEDGKNGYLVPAKDQLALAEAMTKMYHHSPDELETMGAYSREKALQTFDDKIITTTYIKLLKQLIQSSSNEQKARESQTIL